MGKLLAIASGPFVVAVLAGCGMSPGHVSVTVGASAKLDVNRAGSGQTSVQLTVGPRDCHPTRVAMSWQDVSARVTAC